MTAVVWDGKMLAADKQMTCGDLKMPVTKIFKLENGDIVTFTGGFPEGLAMKEWWERGADVKLWPESQKGENWSRLIVYRDGVVFSYEQLPYRIPHEPPMAWGSGQHFALGALYAGADAPRAIAITSELSTSVGMGVDSFAAPKGM